MDQTKTAAADSSAAAPPPSVAIIEPAAKMENDSHDKLYWLWHNMISGPKSLAKKHWVLFPPFILFLLVLLFMSRGYLHEFVIDCRKYFGAFVVSLILLFGTYRYLRQSSLRRKAATLLVYLIGGCLIYFWGQPVHDYFSLYWRYNTLEIVRLKDLPETAHERIQPLNSVFTMASGQIANNNSPTDPHFVRNGDSYCFTMGSEPIYLWPRLFQGVTDIYNIPGTNPDVDLSSNNAKVHVSFECGEQLLFGHNIYTATCRAFGLWRYLNYEPDGAVYLKDDSGNWVQVVPLVRWRGIIFPWPEFGGVQVIEQAPNNLINSFKRSMIGIGHFVSPQEIEAGKYPYLKGQNICSYKVSRYIAESFKFHKGLLAPLPAVHNNDIRIANMPEDCNPPPFVTFNKMSAVAPGASDSLYQYFSLEPYNSNTQGTVAMVFSPADGTPTVYALFNEETKLNLIGISSVPQLVRNDHPYFDWSSHVPVENRQFTRSIDGKKFYFALTTIVTKNEKDNKTFIGGNNPNIALTDEQSRRVYWMKPPDSATWIGQLREQMKFPVGSPQLPKPDGSSGPAETVHPPIAPSVIPPAAPVIVTPPASK